MSDELSNRSRTPNKTRYKRWAQYPFGVAFILGVGVMYWLKQAEVPQLWVTGCGAIVIILYAIVVDQTPEFRIRDDQRGDNCYYLGFLFTLVSLAYALWRFSEVEKVTEIIANFGIALATTIVGILLRVMINQERRDILETEKDARIELATAVVRLRVQIDDAVSGLDAFCRQTRQIAAESIAAAAEGASNALAESIGKVGEASSRTMDRVEEAFSEFKEHASKLTKASSTTVKAIEVLFAKIENIDAPSDLVSRRLEPALAASERVAARLRERLEIDDRALHTASERAVAVEREMKAAVDGVNAVSNAVVKAGVAATEAAKATELAAAHIASIAPGIERIVADQTRVGEEARAAARLMLEQIVREHQGLAGRAAESFAALADSFRLSTTTMAEEAERARRMSAELGNALAELARAVRNHTA